MCLFTERAQGIQCMKVLVGSCHCHWSAMATARPTTQHVGTSSVLGVGCRHVLRAFGGFVGPALGLDLGVCIPPG